MAKNREDNDFRLGDLPEEITARGREVWLAGLGAFATIEEEGSKLFNNLVQRGEKMEQRGKEQIDATVKELEERQEEAEKSVGGTVSQLEEMVSQTMKRVLDRFDVPTRKEVQSLASRVELLSEKIDELSITLERKRTGEVAATIDVEAKEVYHVEPRDDGWAVTKEGNERAVRVHDTKEEAVESGRDIAKRHAPSLLVVHRQDGTEQERFSYESSEENE